MQIPSPHGLRRLAILCLLGLTFGLAGCQTNEASNMSSRPWNQPKGWENGLPGGFNDYTNRR